MRKVVLLLLLVAGCSPSKPETEASDPEEARALLKEALQAWQQGAKPAELTGRAPPVHVADEDWLGGAKLLHFRVVDPGAIVGTSLRCTVELSLETRDRGRVTQTVGYQVSTRPSRFVVRLDNN